jgi:hypothetical protein
MMISTDAAVANGGDEFLINFFLSHELLNISET